MDDDSKNSQIDLENPYVAQRTSKASSMVTGAQSHVSLPSVRTSASPAQAAIMKRKQINASMNEHIAQSQEKLQRFD